MIELEVQDFQSIRHASMTVSGFAAIVGKSNIGKSAIVRAAQYALTGEVGTDFVRHGPKCERKVKGTKECKCFSKVRILTSQVEVTWEKGDSVNRYTVVRDGSKPEVYDGLKRGTPDFLKPAFQLVKVGSGNELIQIPDQFEPIFLLNQSGVAVADVLSDVARLDAINKAMGEANKDRRDATAKAKVREGDVKSLKASLTQYDGLDDVPVDALVGTLKSLETKKKKQDQVGGFLDRLGSLALTLVSLDTTLKPALPDNDLLCSARDQLVKASRFWDSLSEKVPVIRALMEVTKVEVPDENPVRPCSDLLVQVESFLKSLDSVEQAHKSLSSVDDTSLPEWSDLSLVYSKLLTTAKYSHSLEAIETALSKSPEVGDLPDMDLLGKKVSELSSCQRLLDSLVSVAGSIRDLSAAVKVVEADETEALTQLEALGSCPTCSQPLSKNHKLHLETR